MSKWDQPYAVFDTPCYPARYKVGRFAEDDNSTHNYFYTREAADAEARRRHTFANILQSLQVEAATTT